MGNILCAATPKDDTVVLAKYLFYYLNYKKDYLLVHLMRKDANVFLTISSLTKVKIALPPLAEQERIMPVGDWTIIKKNV